MSNIYNKNMMLLKKYRPQLHKNYKEAVEKQQYDYCCDRVEVLKAKDGSKILSVVRGGKKIRLNSMYNPVREAQQWAMRFNMDNIKVRVIMFGLGNGMYAEAILDRMDEKDAILIIYEPSFQIFEKMIKSVDLEKIISNKQVILYINNLSDNTLRNTIGYYIDWTTLDTQINCYHTGYERLFEDAYHDFLIALRKEIENAIVSNNTQNFFGQRMAKNMIRNMKFIKSASLISAYEEKFPRDLPFIIIAAGPSLDKNIEELRRAKGKAFIMAVDTAMRSLMNKGIYPDAMITLDPGKPFSYMNDPAITNIPLFCVLEANNEIMEFHRGLKIWFDGSSFLAKLFNGYGKKFLPYSAGGSVATGAFMVGVSLKFKHIILVGQDLAYQGGATHANGQTDRMMDEEKNVYEIEGIDGYPVKSRPDWMMYRDWFEQAILFLKNKDIEVIDATEGGALIHGSKIMTLREVVNEYCQQEVNVEKILNGSENLFDEIEYDQLASEIHGYKNDLRIIKKQSQDGEKYCEKILEMIVQNEQNDKIIEMQEKIQQLISNIKSKNVYSLVDTYMSKDVDTYLDGIYIVDHNMKKNELTLYGKTKKIFEYIDQSVDELLPIVEENI